MTETLRLHPWIGFALAGLAAFLASAFVQSPGNFPDPDSFYHARMAMEIRDHGVVHDFPWLTQTIFADSYVDHHFLYHILLIPFVSLPDPLLGIRISAVLFAVAAMVGAALLLRALGVSGAALATFFLTVSNPFLFRMNLAKTPSLSLLLVFLGFWAAARAKPLLLAAIAFVYVWLYDGWPILLVVVGAAAVGDAAASLDLRTIISRRSLRLVGAAVAGLALGHLVNPYFPHNLPFEWLHIVRIGIVGFRDQFGVGLEWYPWKPHELLASTGTTFILILAAAFAGLAASLSRERRPVPRERIAETIAFGVLAAIAFAFTLKAKRNVEYFVPFAVLFSFSAIDCARRSVPDGWFPAWFRSFRPPARVAAAAAACCLGLMLPFLVARDILGVRRDFDSGVPSSKYEKLSRWLRANTPSGSVVFHNDWDDFPYFFIRDTHNRYLVGLDPAFMYAKNPERFREWVEITQGRDVAFLGARIREHFGAEYAFVDRDHGALDSALSRDPLFRLVYSDEEGKIYRFVPPAGFAAGSL